MSYPMPATYRYTLTRSWGASSDFYEGRICCVMLNPSTADESVDDPTIRRVIRFSEDHGFAELVVVNLFAVRSTDPKNLELFEDAVGPDNTVAIFQAMVQSTLVVYAWGASGIPCMKRNQIVEVNRCAYSALRTPLCLGKTKDGSPRHPLYVKADTRLVPY